MGHHSRHGPDTRSNLAVHGVPRLTLQARPVRLKCERCRRDRVACQPADRFWPDRKCDRCLHYGYECGPNVPPPHRAPRAATAVPTYSAQGPRTILTCIQVRRYLETEIKGRIEDVIPQA